MYTSLKNRVALVTGGTKGIGKAIADKLSVAGAKVIVTARSTPSENRYNQHFIATDLVKPESAEDIAKEVLNKYGRIDIIVNNAGANLSPTGGYSVLTDEHWNDSFQLNLMSAVRINKAFLPTMIEQKSGSIINISTVASIQPLWEMTMAYSPAKAALNIYSKALASEVGPKGIRVNVVSPGLVKTQLMLDFIDSIAKTSNISSEEAMKSVLEKLTIPLGNMAEPEEIANIVAFLSSDEAKYVTGSNYAVDGGALPTV